MTRWGLLSLSALLWLACLAAPPPVAAQVRDEVVPAGVWRLHVDTASHTESESFVATRNHQSLLDYLVPDATVRGALQGGVTRRWKRLELRATYGLSDTWNVVLAVPWAQVQQTSTLSSTLTDAAVQTQLTRLRTRTLTGMGRMELASLHRTIFTDRDGLVLGYGLNWPTHLPHSLWAGRGTLLVDSPFPRAFGVLHYTFYPFIRRTHLDVRVEVGVPFTQTMSLVEGGHATVNPGNDLTASLGWTQEFGPVVTGVGASLYRQGASLINHRRQGDTVTAATVRLEVGYGNLTALEQGPVAFPYQARLELDQGLGGYDVPVVQAVHATLRFYF